MVCRWVGLKNFFFKIDSLLWQGELQMNMLCRCDVNTHFTAAGYLIPQPSHKGQVVVVQ